MKLIALFWLISGAVLSGCRQRSTQHIQAATNLFPVRSILRALISRLDSRLSRNRLRWAGIAVLLLLPSPFTQAATAPQAADQLLQHLITAARAGNTNDFLSDLTAASREAITAALAAQSALDAAQADFRAALDQRFGKEPASKGVMAQDDLRAVISHLSAAEVLSTKEISPEKMQVVARIQIKSRAGKTASSEQTLLLQQERGAWKLQVPIPQKESNFAARAISALQRTTNEIREGRFKDRASAMVALDRALPREEQAKK